MVKLFSWSVLSTRNIQLPIIVKISWFSNNIRHFQMGFDYSKRKPDTNTSFSGKRNQQANHIKQKHYFQIVFILCETFVVNLVNVDIQRSKRVYMTLILISKFTTFKLCWILVSPLGYLPINRIFSSTDLHENVIWLWKWLQGHWSQHLMLYQFFRTLSA